MKEIWQPIQNLSNYEVSNKGRVRSKDQKLENRWGPYIKKARILKPYLNEYLQVTLVDDRGKKVTRKVHRLVACSFLTKPSEGLQVNHKDGDKMNNCVDNLEWVTAQENVKHSYVEGLACNRGSRHPRSKLTEEKVRQIRARHQEGESLSSMARDMGLAPSTVQKAVKGTYWRHVV